MNIRRLKPDDLEFACSLVEVAGWNQTQADWERLLTAEPEGCFLIESDGEPAGTATTTSYGTDLAWIGMVLVDRRFRRKGLATEMLNRCLSYLADERPVQCIKLDATPEGMKVYEKLGFEVEFELSRWSGQSRETGEFRNTAVEFKQVLHIDNKAFGADRSDYLVSLSKDSCGGVCSDAGYGLIRKGRIANYLGPLVSDCPEFAREAVIDLLRAPVSSQVFWDIPEDNQAAVEMAMDLGFERKRRLIRMWTGSRNFPGDNKLQWAIGAPETG